MEKVFSAKPEELDNVLDFANSALEKVNCPMKIQSAVDVCLEELFVNIAHYAYPGRDGTAVIDVEADGLQKFVSIRLADNGIRFNPLAKPDPDTTLQAEERSIGGLGIFMVKQMMDSVEYEYADGKNILTIKKFF